MPDPLQIPRAPRAVQWRGSSTGPGGTEIAFVTAQGQVWVLMRLAGDSGQRVSVFTWHEWDCFLDGVKNGEFDAAGA